MLCENWSKNGSGKHQHQNHIEQPVIDQALTGGISSIEGHQGGRECRDGRVFSEKSQDMRSKHDSAEQQANHRWKPGTARNGGNPTIIAIPRANFASDGSE